MAGFKAFLKRKNIVFSLKRYGIDALGAMAQGLFCSLLIGTIIKTLGAQIGAPFLVDIGAYAMAVSDAARDKVFELAQTMTYVELSTTPGYMGEFMAACFLPHTNAELFPSCME